MGVRIRQDMQKNRQTANTVFLIVTSLAALFVLVELILKSFGKSICAYEGCKMTAQYARFGDGTIFSVGLAAFLSLVVLTVASRQLGKPSLERLINLVLVVALASEGFFMGYLAFRIHTVCVICVSIFGFIVLLGIIRLLSGEADLIAGFGALGAVFFMQYLVLPAGIPVDLPANERLILFYSKDCRHCAELIKGLDEKKISVARLLVSEYAGFLENMGIDSVPTLMVNEKYQKVFLTGKEAIDRYLAACTVQKKSADKPGQKPKAKATAEAPVQGTGTSIDMFSQPGLLLSAPSPSADEGLCKEDEICK